MEMGQMSSPAPLTGAPTGAPTGVQPGAPTGVPPEVLTTASPSPALPAPPLARLQVASMSSAAAALCSHIVFGGTALQHEALRGLAIAILVSASLGLLTDAVAAGFTIRMVAIYQAIRD